MYEIARDFDILRLRRSGSRSVVEIGETDVSYATHGANVHMEMNQLPKAAVDLTLDLIAGQPVDYFGELHVGRTSHRHNKSWFRGTITEAAPSDDRVHLESTTHAPMQMRMVGGFAGINIHPGEAIHLMSRTAGLREDQIHIQELDQQLPLEAVEVVVPLTGITVERPHRVGLVTFVPPEVGLRAVEQFDETSAGAQEFAEATACAMGTTVQRRLFDAELEVIGSIDTVLSWLTVRSRYGLALLPQGTPQHFKRVTAMSRPARGTFVTSRGIQSKRQWIRDTNDAHEHSSIPLNDLDQEWDLPSTAQLSMQNQQALLACARAATGSNQIQRVQAVWEAIEFYVQGTKPGRAFAKADIKTALATLSDDIDEALRDRITEVAVRGVNEASLAMKLDHTLRQDGVPISNDERRLLKQLRDTRNDVVHGRSTELPKSEDVDRAVGLVSRMLVYRLDRARRFGTRTRSTRNRASHFRSIGVRR